MSWSPLEFCLPQSSIATIVILNKELTGMCTQRWGVRNAPAQGCPVPSTCLHCCRSPLSSSPLFYWDLYTHSSRPLQILPSHQGLKSSCEQGLCGDSEHRGTPYSTPVDRTVTHVVTTPWWAPWPHLTMWPSCCSSGLDSLHLAHPKASSPSDR